MTAQQTMEERAPRFNGTDIRERLLAALPVTERRVQAGGISTAVLEGGDGPPVVLLHGPGEHAPKWMRVIPQLVETHRVVAPDLPGHGATEMPREPIDAPTMLAWLGELIERTCSSPPAIVGQIVGGAIAARFAIDHGDRVDRLVLVDMLGLAPFQPAPQFAAALNDFMTQPNADTHDRLWQQCAFDLDGMRAGMGDRWEQMKAYNLELARMPTLLAAEQALIGEFGMAPIPAEELARITVPVTLIWGRHDLATPLGVATAASARHGWPLRIIENAGDDPAMEQPEAFVRVLRDVRGGS